MAIDPKIRSGAQPLSTLSPTATPALSAQATELLADVPVALPSGFSTVSTFVSHREQKLAEGRTAKGGIADDSVGRTAKGGIADDSVGRTSKGGIADDSVGRTSKGGIADDSVGRGSKGGIPDDSVGRGSKGGIPDDSVGRTSKPKGTSKPGIPDDSVGRTKPAPPPPSGPKPKGPKKGGIPDDSVGQDTTALAATDLVRDALVGPDNDPVREKVRFAVYNRIERPAYLTDQTTDLKNTITEHVLASPAYQALSTTDQNNLKSLMFRLNNEGLSYLGSLVEQNAFTLNLRDSKGGTLVSSLNKLATQPFNPNLARDTNASEVVNAVLRDIVNPNRVVQGDAPTCTVTSMQYELVMDNPAEYARLMTGLASSKGKVEMQLGGEMRVDAGDSDPSLREGRSISQTLFQTAAMEYANGSKVEFDPKTGISTDSTTGKTFRGLQPKMQSMMLRQLFGTNYRTTPFYSEAEGAKALVTLQNYDARAHVNRPVILDIDQGPINHAVTLESVKNGQINYRDPYGVLRTMPDFLFVKYVVAMHQPLNQG